MIELKSYIWSMIVKRKTKTYFKIETIIWWTNDSAQASSKDVRLSNITIIALMHRNNKYNYNHLRDDVAYDIFNLIFLLHHIKCWQWWNYHIQRSVRVFKINLYKRRIKERNIYITSVIKSHLYFKKISTSNVDVSNKSEIDVVSLM